MRKIIFGIALICLNCCTSILRGHIELTDFDQTYNFNFSKKNLKDKIVEQYSYDVGLLSKNLGRIIIENPEVNKKSRVSVTEWLDKKDWDKYKDEIRQSIADTTDVLLVRHHSLKSILVRLVITGDENTSNLRIINITADRRREYIKPNSFYKDHLLKTINNKFIRKLG